MWSKTRYVNSVLVLSGIIISSLSLAQTDRGDNLRTCLTGKFPSLCNYSLLTPDQRTMVREAESQENLKTCLTGKFPSLCDRSKLSGTELTAVLAAEKRENLEVCLSGRFPSLCKYSLLSPEELERARAAEKAENLRVCSDGRFPTLCNKALLTSGQASVVAEAEAKAVIKQSTTRSTATRTNCESGHWIDSVSSNGKILKLEDGSMWSVSDVDTVTSSIWLPISDVIVCGTKIINVDDSETVEASRISPTPQPGTASSGTPTYTIQASSNDESFVINGEIFKAKTYCFNMEKGDKVIFASGSPAAICTSAEILNLRTGRMCRVWCE